MCVRCIFPSGVPAKKIDFVINVGKYVFEYYKYFNVHCFDENSIQISHN